MTELRGSVTVEWGGADPMPPDVIPMDRVELVVWKDRWGSVHATGAQADEPAFDDVVRGVLVGLNLNPVIEPSYEERLDG